MLTQIGKLIIGIEKDGKIHQDFVMRMATIADSISAIEKAGPDASPLKLRVFKIAEQLVEIGLLQELSGDDLMQLADIDFEPLLEAQDDLEKKLKASRSSYVPIES